MDVRAIAYNKNPNNRRHSQRYVARQAEPKHHVWLPVLVSIPNAHGARAGGDAGSLNGMRNGVVGAGWSPLQPVTRAHDKRAIHTARREKEEVLHRSDARTTEALKSRTTAGEG